MLVHCNGPPLANLGYFHSSFFLLFSRWHQPITGLRRDVRDAALSTLMGGRPAHGAKPTLLHFAQRRVSYADQGSSHPKLLSKLSVLISFRNMRRSTRLMSRMLLSLQHQDPPCGASAQMKMTRRKNGECRLHGLCIFRFTSLSCSFAEETTVNAISCITSQKIRMRCKHDRQRSGSTLSCSRAVSSRCGLLLFTSLRYHVSLVHTLYSSLCCAITLIRCPKFNMFFNVTTI